MMKRRNSAPRFIRVSLTNRASLLLLSCCCGLINAPIQTDKDATPEPTPMSTSLNTGGAGTIAHILQLLDDEAADEEERIENVRSAFGDALEEVEGSRAVSMPDQSNSQPFFSHVVAVPFASRWTRVGVAPSSSRGRTADRRNFRTSTQRYICRTCRFTTKTTTFAT